MAEVNPIHDTYDALWAMLESKTAFTDLFPNGTVHQVRYTTSRSYIPDPDLSELAPADFPLCRVVLVKAAPMTERDSSTSMLELVFAVEVCGGEQAQNKVMAASWAIYTSMLNWRTYVRDAVTYQGVACVHDVDSVGFDITDASSERNRGTNQWIAVWNTKVQLYFPTATLQTN